MTKGNGTNNVCPVYTCLHHVINNHFFRLKATKWGEGWSSVNTQMNGNNFLPLHWCTCWWQDPNDWRPRHRLSSHFPHTNTSVQIARTQRNGSSVVSLCNWITNSYYFLYLCPYTFLVTGALNINSQTRDPLSLSNGRKLMIELKSKLRRNMEIDEERREKEGNTKWISYYHSSHSLFHDLLRI